MTYLDLIATIIYQQVSTALSQTNALTSTAYLKSLTVVDSSCIQHLHILANRSTVLSHRRSFTRTLISLLTQLLALNLLFLGQRPQLTWRDPLVSLLMIARGTDEALSDIHLRRITRFSGRGRSITQHILDYFIQSCIPNSSAYTLNCVHVLSRVMYWFCK